MTDTLFLLSSETDRVASTTRGGAKAHRVPNHQILEGDIRRACIHQTVTGNQLVTRAESHPPMIDALRITGGALDPGLMIRILEPIHADSHHFQRRESVWEIPKKDPTSTPSMLPFAPQEAGTLQHKSLTETDLTGQGLETGDGTRETRTQH
mmetsp:Transcript_18851/g.29461  ORF Transcript_18851/g.29461 Transcript_18851/m.29461 type:complete len:152 (-) Transcript_18851:2068-2523(-)